MTTACSSAGELPVLDATAIAALRSFGSVPGRLLDLMVTDFLVEAPASFADLVGAAGRGDATAVAALAHRLKGVCGHMGARRLGAACEAIRTSAIEHDGAGLSSALAAGRIELDAALREVGGLDSLDADCSPAESG